MIDATARETLAGVVVGVAREAQGEARGQEGAEALARGSLEVDLDVVVGQRALAQQRA